MSERISGSSQSGYRHSACARQIETFCVPRAPVSGPERVSVLDCLDHQGRLGLGSKSAGSRHEKRLLRRTTGLEPRYTHTKPPPQNTSHPPINIINWHTCDSSVSCKTHKSLGNARPIRTEFSPPPSVLVEADYAFTESVCLLSTACPPPPPFASHPSREEGRKKKGKSQSLMHTRAALLEDQERYIALERKKMPRKRINKVSFCSMVVHAMLCNCNVSRLKS